MSCRPTFARPESFISTYEQTLPTNTQRQHSPGPQTESRLHRHQNASLQAKSLERSRPPLRGFYQSSLRRHFFTGVFIPLRIDFFIPGMDSRWRVSLRPFSSFPGPYFSQMARDRSSKGRNPFKHPLNRRRASAVLISDFLFTQTG